MDASTTVCASTQTDLLCIMCIVNDISLKLDASGYISVAESLGVSSTTFMQCASQATEFGEITQNKGC